MPQSQTSNAVIIEFVEPEPESVVRPKRLRLERDPGAISTGDESALSWYFGQGLSIYDHSTFGAVLQRITCDGFGSGPCERCHGDGILNDGGFAMSTRCHHCRGSGMKGEHKRLCEDCRGSGVVTAYEVRAAHGGWCDDCHGSGSTSMSRRSMRPPKCSGCGGVRWSAARAECGVCLGGGIELVTAVPTTMPDSTSGAIPDHSALTRFAVTSRRLAMVADRSPALVETLECYYGDVGARWAREDFGRLFSLFALTPCGKKLSRWGENKKNAGRVDRHSELTAQERVGVQAVLEKTQPKRERTVLLSAAKEQAQALYADAASAWNQAQPDRADKGLLRLARRFMAAGMTNAATHLMLASKGRQ